MQTIAPQRQAARAANAVPCQAWLPWCAVLHGALAAILCGAWCCSVAPRVIWAQRAAAPRERDSALPSVSQSALEVALEKFVSIPAIPGYEEELAGEIRASLAALHPQVDSLGDVIVEIGQGSPRRLIVAPIDEPGYVASSITTDGYLTLQRLPQADPLASHMFDTLFFAQPVKIATDTASTRKWIDAVVAGQSVHLEGSSETAEPLEDLERMYVDIGASSSAEVRRSGAGILSPVAASRQMYRLGFGKLTSFAIGDRFGAAALLALARQLDAGRIRGTLLLAFVVQQWAGARGLTRILQRYAPDEMVYAGRLLPERRSPAAGAPRRAPRREPGSGVLLGITNEGETLPVFADQIKNFAKQNNIPLVNDYSAPLLPPSYLPLPALPARWVHLGVAAAWPTTPAEMIDSGDLRSLWRLLGIYAQGSAAPEPASPTSAAGAINPALIPELALPQTPQTTPPMAEILRSLVETYGVSGHETPVRESVMRLLPPWAKPETDPDGNLVLSFHLPESFPANRAKPARILAVAHLDEIGLVVRAISENGRLEAEWAGGGRDEFFAGHAALVHTSAGIRPAVIELPDGWDQPGFRWRSDGRQLLRVDVGARTPEQAQQLGVRAGDTVTIPKRYRPLLGTRANGRSFDDRVGCAALIAAAWNLRPAVRGRDITFLWSTGEEVGLQGAFAAAQRLGRAGRAPDYVFAIDTFVSSDSPLESKRFADALLGHGFVVRAVDNSNVVPYALVDRVLGLARAGQIPAQYGVTGGGNDGSAFLRFGSIDVALGWPLRYSHSPGEVIDTRDAEALARIVAALAQKW